MLLGVEFDAELARGRAIEAGQSPDREPYVEPRDTTKIDRADDQDSRLHIAFAGDDQDSNST